MSEKTRREAEEDQRAIERPQRASRRAPRRARSPRRAPRAPRRAPRAAKQREDAPRRAQRAAAARREEARKQRSRQRSASAAPFELPDTDLLATPKQRITHADAQTLHAMSRQLEGVLADFGVQGEVRFRAPRPCRHLVRARARRRREILARHRPRRRHRALHERHRRRVAVIPGRNAIGIELPNGKRETVFLRSLLN